MSKIKKIFTCSDCGASSIKWSGQCTECLSWGTVNEEFISNNNPASKNITSDFSSISGNVLDFDNLDDNFESEQSKIETNNSELNRVLGGGFVFGSIILIGGEPGIGKSTLLLQIAASMPSINVIPLYVTAEESANQIKLRSSRLGLIEPRANVVASNSVEDIISTIEKNKEIKLLIIDSIQTIQTSKIDSAPGTVSQIKTTSQMLINYAKKKDIILIIVCHITKDGQLAGPKLLEHMVDTVLYFESDSNYHYRILRSMKNRFGSVNEIGVFEMTSKGLNEIPNPSEFFISNRSVNVSGTSIFAGVEGMRPILGEIQVLLAPSNMAIPRRSVIGWDQNRLSMILAVLAVRCKINLMNHEVYLTISGGLKILEPAADLAVAAALFSAVMNKRISSDTIFFGEIGLSGEVRKSSYFEARVKESKKLGFNKIVCRSDEKGVNSIDHIVKLKNFIEQND
jgi:DNA repair protein RadA/Sms